jgi:CDP-glucose 4,6-dehydratase
MTMKFYKNKNILITGHTGFKGIWLTNLMLYFGAKVNGISKKDHNIKNYEKCTDSRKVKNYYFDIRDKKKLQNTLYTIRPNIVFHLAAQAIVKNSFEDPINTFETNINGTLNILEFSRKINSIKSIVIITSDKCYLNNKKKFLKETDPLGGIDPYSASKSGAEIIVNSYLSSFYKSKQIGLASARGGNVLGGGDWSDGRLIPDCTKSIIKNKKLFIRNFRSVRPWQHVIDVIHGYSLLAKKIYQNKEFSGNWNFGPKEKKQYNVGELVNLFFYYMKVKKKFIKKNMSPNIIESKYLQLDSKKSQKYLKWKTQINIYSNIKKTAEWYQGYLQKKNLRDIIMKQISDFKYFK